MDLHKHDKTIHLLFNVSLIGKAIDGGLEVIGGVLLFFVNPGQINWLVRTLTQHELSEDPQDFVATLVLQSVQHLSSGTRSFAALFLLWHGVVKVGLIIGLLRKLRWSYPIAIAAFGLFLMYQMYRYSHTHSAWLLALSILDLIVIIVTWLEFKRLGSLRAFPELH